MLSKSNIFLLTILLSSTAISDILGQVSKFVCHFTAKFLKIKYIIRLIFQHWFQPVHSIQMTMLKNLGMLWLD